MTHFLRPDRPGDPVLGPAGTSDVRRAWLAAGLRAHVPADRREAQHRERMLSLAGKPGDVFSRRHFEPGHFTASALVLSPDGSALLLVLHQRLGRWLQPGGHVDAGDPDLVAAARREVREETGIEDLVVAAPESSPFLDLDIHPIPARGDEPAHEHFDVRVVLHAGTGRLEAGAGVNGVRWVPLAAVARLVSDESVRRAVAKLGAPRARRGGRT